MIVKYIGTALKFFVQILFKKYVPVEHSLDCHEKRHFIEYYSKYVDVALIPKSILSDKEICVALLKSRYIFGYMDSKLYTDRDVAIEAFKYTPISSIITKLKIDKDIALMAVKCSYNALLYCDKSIRDDKEVVMTAIDRFPYAYSYASTRLKADEDVLYRLLSDYRSSSYTNLVDKSHLTNKALILRALDRSAAILTWLPENMLDDREVILAALKHDRDALSRAGKNVKSDREVVLESMGVYPWTMEYASDELKNDLGFALIAMKIYCWTFTHLSKALTNNIIVWKWLLYLSEHKFNDISERRNNSIQFKKFNGIYSNPKKLNDYINVLKYGNGIRYNFDYIQSDVMINYHNRNIIF